MEKFAGKVEAQQQAVEIVCQVILKDDQQRSGGAEAQQTAEIVQIYMYKVILKNCFVDQQWSPRQNYGLALKL